MLNAIESLKRTPCRTTGYREGTKTKQVLVHLDLSEYKADVNMARYKYKPLVVKNEGLFKDISKRPEAMVKTYRRLCP